MGRSKLSGKAGLLTHFSLNNLRFKLLVELHKFSAKLQHLTNGGNKMVDFAPLVAQFVGSSIQLLLFGHPVEEACHFGKMSFYSHQPQFRKSSSSSCPSKGT